MREINKKPFLFFRSIFKTKYHNIITPVFFMLIITALILGGVYRLSEEINKLHIMISYANRQTINVQNLKNSIYNIDLYTQELRLKLLTADEREKNLLIEYIRHQLSLIGIYQKEIDQSIYLFTYGGNVNLDSKLLKIKSLKEGKLKIDIEKADEYWQPYQRLISSFQKALDEGTINSEIIRFASDYTRIFSDNLYYEFSDIAFILQNKVDTLNFYMRITMILGLTIAILLFAYIILVAIRQLLLKDAALEIARQETVDIMRTVKDGLFLVYPDYKISYEYSAKLSSIIKQDNIGGRSLHDLMQRIISEKDMEITKEFLQQLFNAKVVEDLIGDLNPLERIKAVLTNDKGLSISRYLSFNFSRVYEEKKISRVLVSVRDITDAIELEKKLEKERKQHDEELEMLASILHIDSLLLSDFIRSAQKKTQEINNILKISTTKGTQALKEKAEQIFRQVHSLKGEASALKLHHYVSLMEHFEQLLKDIREQQSLTGNHFLPLVVDLDKLIEFNEKINHLNQSLRQKNILPTSENNLEQRAQKMSIFLQQYADDIAKRNTKKVHLQCHGLKYFSQLSQEQQDIIKELIIQLLRNAVVHGIENPERRQSSGKAEVGKIQIKLEQKDGQLLLTIQDDGQGIDYQRLRQQAVTMNVVSKDKAKNMTCKELVKFMLLPNVSTMANSNEDAGRGVGSDIIVSNVKALNGKLGVASQTGIFTRFSVIFPQ